MPCSIWVILSSGGGGGGAGGGAGGGGGGVAVAGWGGVGCGVEGAAVAGGVSWVDATGVVGRVAASFSAQPHAKSTIDHGRILRSMATIVDDALVSLDARFDFVRIHTALARPSSVPEVVLYTATELTPLWQATLAWLGSFGIDAPFWSVPWAGGQGLARWVLDHPEEVRGKRVVDFGAGSGLVGLACALAGASSVRAIDVDPLSEAACLLNARANGVEIDFTCADIVGSAIDADVLVAGDVWYERAAAARFGPWLRELSRSGVRVLTGDPGRAYVPEAREIARLSVPTSQDLESTTERRVRVLEI